mgnify:CR=1 FL=1
MSDGSISQAEIDALLGGGSSSSSDVGGAGGQSFEGVSKFVDGNISQFSSKLGVTTGSTASFTKSAVEEKENDVIVEVIKKGYFFKDRLLRASLVKVNKK